MRILLTLTALVVPLTVVADGCLRAESGFIVNDCERCMRVTIAEYSVSGTTTVAMRTVDIQPGQREAIPTDRQAAVTEFTECQ